MPLHCNTKNSTITTAVTPASKESEADFKNTTESHSNSIGNEYDNHTGSSSRGILIPTRRGNSCPVCGDTKGKCRTKPGSDLIHCMNGVGGTLDGARGYSYIKDSHNGLWGLYGIQNRREDWRQSDPNAYRDENGKLPNPIPRKRESDPPTNRSPLTRIDRDCEYRKLLAQFPLTDTHRQKLECKGLEDFSRYGSIPKPPKGGRKIEDIDVRLPGILPDGTLNYWGQDGALLIATVDADGHIVGCQVRLDNTNDGGRYRNLTSRNKRNPKGFQPHIDGEMPLTYFHGEGRTVYLAEGVGYKAQRTAELTRGHVIGASGGMFDSSPKLLEEYLGKIAKGEGCTVGELKVVAVPDGGDRINRHVMRRWGRVYDSLQKLSIHNLGVLWWGQVAKGQDIDEVEPDRIQGAAIKSFELFVGEFRAQEKLEARFRMSPEDKARFLAEFEIDGAIAFEDKYVPSELLAQDGCAVFMQSGTNSGKTTAMAAAIALGLTVAEKIERGREEGRGAIIVSFRNGLLLQIQARLKEAGIEAEHLQTDLRGIINCDDPQYTDTRILPDSVILICPDSLTHLSPAHFQGKDIYIDESEGTADHIASAKTSISQYRGKAMEMFEAGVERARSVTFLDGLMTRSGVEFWKGYMGSKTVLTYKKADNPIRPRTRLFLGEVDVEAFANGKTKWSKVKEDKTLTSEIVEATGAVPVVSDNQEYLTALEGGIRDRNLGAKVMRIDSTTINTKAVRDFIADPEREIERHGYSHILMSPTVEAGFDLNVYNYFNHAYVVTFGVLRTQKIVQILARIRDAQVPLTMSIALQLLERGDYADNRTAQEIFNDSLEAYRTEVGKAFTDDPGEFGEFYLNRVKTNMTPIDRYRISQQKHQALEEDNLRGAVWALLEATGYEVEPYVVAVNGFDDEFGDRLEAATEIAQELKDRKSAIKNAQAVAISTAPSITPEEADELVTKSRIETMNARREGREPQELTQEEQASIKRANLTRKFPGIDKPNEFGVAPIDNADTVKDVVFDRHLVSQIDRILAHRFPELARLTQKSKVYGMAKRTNKRIAAFEEARMMGANPSRSAPKYDTSQDVFDPLRFKFLIQTNEAFDKLGFRELTEGEPFTGGDGKISAILQKLRKSPQKASWLGVRKSRNASVKAIIGVLERFGYKVKRNRNENQRTFEVTGSNITPDREWMYRARIVKTLEGLAANGVKFTDALIEQLGIEANVNPETGVSTYTYEGREIAIAEPPTIPQKIQGLSGSSVLAGASPPLFQVITSAVQKTPDGSAKTAAKKQEDLEAKKSPGRKPEGEYRDDGSANRSIERNALPSCHPNLQARAINQPSKSDPKPENPSPIGESLPSMTGGEFDTFALMIRLTMEEWLNGQLSEDEFGKEMEICQELHPKEYLAVVNAPEFARVFRP